MTRPTWTPQRRLLRDLMEAFFDVPPRRTSVSRITSRGPEPGSRPVEPAAKLEHHDAPAAKVEHADKPKHPAVKVRKAKAGPVVTNTGAPAVAHEPVVDPIVRVESALRPRRPGDVTNAARQSRWRGKQDAAALRLQAQVRMKSLRAKRKAGRNVPMLSS